MSRIGKAPVIVPKGVKALVDNGVLKVEGPKGKLSLNLPDGIQITVEGDSLKAIRRDDSKSVRAKHGLARALMNNMVKGVSQGYERKLEINGVGYRAAVKGKSIDLTLGFSHPVVFALPEGITAKVDANTQITISGADKALVGEVSAKIRSIKPPEPYQGKGIKYATETIKRKAGKSAATGAK